MSKGNLVYYRAEAVNITTYVKHLENMSGVGGSRLGLPGLRPFPATCCATGDKLLKPSVPDFLQL